MPKNTITIELTVEEAQELYATTDKKSRDIDWILENRRPRNAEELDQRAKLLTKIATQLKKALNDRAKAETNVVPLSGKK